MGPRFAGRPGARSRFSNFLSRSRKSGLSSQVYSRATVKAEDIEARIREDIQKVFPAGEGVERVFFPDKSGQIPDRPAITFVVLDPDQSFQECPSILSKIESMTKEYGRSSRVFKSGFLWIVAEAGDSLRTCARDFLAWQDIKDEGVFPPPFVYRESAAVR